MTKTIDGKFIFTHKGEDYVPLNDYVKLLQEKEDLKEKVILLRASEPMLELEKYYGERDKYKEVLIELKAKILGLLLKIDEQDFLVSEEELEKLLQILDKAKGNK